jgi:hypothetical protein
MRKWAVCAALCVMPGGGRTGARRRRQKKKRLVFLLKLMALALVTRWSHKNDEAKWRKKGVQKPRGQNN